MNDLKGSKLLRANLISVDVGTEVVGKKFSKLCW